MVWIDWFVDLVQILPFFFWFESPHTYFAYCNVRMTSENPHLYRAHVHTPPLTLLDSAFRHFQPRFWPRMLPPNLRYPQTRVWVVFQFGDANPQTWLTTQTCHHQTRVWWKLETRPKLAIPKLAFGSCFSLLMPVHKHLLWARTKINILASVLI